MTHLAQGESALLRIMGIPLIAYVCNATASDVAARLDDGQNLVPIQEAAIAQLAALADQVSAASEVQNVPISLFLDGLGVVPHGADTSPANLLRLASGGSIDLPTTEDPVAALLLRVARDVFPVLLLPQDNEFPFSNLALSRPLFLHPLHSELEVAILADEDLKRLFPSESEHSGRYGMTFRSTGAGGSVQSSMLHQLVIQDAWKWIEFSGADKTISSLAQGILVTLDRVRRALREEEVEVQVAIGFAGLLLPEGSVLDLPNGRLRSATPKDLDFVPSGLPGKLSHTTEDGTSITIDYAGDVVLETSVPYRVVVSDSEDGWPASEWGTLERRIEAVTLAALLAFKRWPTATMVPTWRILFDPLSHGPMLSWSDPRGGPGLTPFAATLADGETLRDWIIRVDGGRRKSMEIGIRRLISATTQRRDAVDGLVDAVIVWENLFGTRQGEVTMRVAASLAWLLESDTESRERRYSEVAKLYNVRSDVVHGNRIVPSEEAVAANRSAIEVALEAFRVLLTERADLLDLSGGDLRSRRLIVGG